MHDNSSKSGYMGSPPAPDNRPEHYFLNDYRFGSDANDDRVEPADWLVSVSVIVNDAESVLGHVPAELSSERACQTFAVSCRIPLCDLDIEDGLFVHGDVKHHPRFASRAWLCEQYKRFYRWLSGTAWMAREAKLERAKALAAA